MAKQDSEAYARYSQRLDTHGVMKVEKKGRTARAVTTYEE